MGRFEIKGDGSSGLLQSLLTNYVAQLHDYKALYSPMCNQEGGIIDDLIVYRKGKNEYILVVNASNRIKDYAWIPSHLTSMTQHSQRPLLQYKDQVEIHDTTFSTSLIAVQGPSANDLMCKLTVNDTDVSKLKSFSMVDTDISGIKCMVSRTGYTGEDGFEIMFDSPGTKIREALIETGKECHIKPCGLGSRDSLRLEAGLLLHGIDMDDNTTPLEIPLKWTVKFEKGDFIGMEHFYTKKFNAS
jgi:aminomethyltransferase